MTYYILCRKSKPHKSIWDIGILYLKRISKHILRNRVFSLNICEKSRTRKKLWSQWQVYPSLTCVYRPTSRSVLQLSLNSEKRYPTYWTTAANRVYMNTYCASDGNTALKPYVKYSGNLNYIIKSKYIFGIFAETSPNFLHKI